MKTQENQIENIILDVLEDWSDSEINFKSEAARKLLATALTEPLSTYMTVQSRQLMEDVICGVE